MENSENLHSSSSFDADDKQKHPPVTDVNIFLPWCCKQYGIEIDMVVTRATTKKEVSSKRAESRSKNVSFDDYSHSSTSVINNENVTKIELVYDKSEQLEKINFLKNKIIPRKIVQIIALIIPYHKYLTSITINSGLRKDTIHEIAKFLPDSNITELCFDGSFLAEANYHTLLMNSKLKHLSLARCSINDTVVKTIVDQLAYPHPASKVLSALNMSSNRITDVGAKYVAGMLRTNRQLCYLNLAGNMLTDEGGTSIFDTLQKFPLYSQELLESRARYVTYIKKKNEFIQEIVTELQKAEDEKSEKNKSFRKNKKSESRSLQHVRSRKRQKSIDVEDEAQIRYEKAEHLAETNIGLFIDHFSINNTESQDGVVRCFGNNTLCYLNLAYNNLTYDSVKKLREVLVMQNTLNRTPRGLIKVVIEGNLMPVACSEFKEIDRLLAVSIRTNCARNQTEFTQRKKRLTTALSSTKPH